MMPGDTAQSGYSEWLEGVHMFSRGCHAECVAEVLTVGISGGRQLRRKVRDMTDSQWQRHCNRRWACLEWEAAGWNEQLLYSGDVGGRPFSGLTGGSQGESKQPR